MSKIIKAQNGLSFAIPIIRTLSQVFPRIGVLPKMFSQSKEVVGEKELNNAFRTYALKKAQELGKKSVERFTVPRTTSAEQSNTTRVARPVVVPTRRYINLHPGGTKAIPVAGQSSTATPVMAKRKKKGVAVGQEQKTPRDTVRVANGAATENVTPQGTTKVDDRNILQKLGDALDRRKKQNGSTENPENKPHKKLWDKIKTVGKWGMYSFVANEADNRFLNGGVKKIVKGALDLGFDEPDTVYIEKPVNTDVIKKRASTQNDTTQAYNGFLINQQNLVE